MRYEKMPIAEIREWDAPAMRQAIQTLLAEGIDVRRPVGNDHQLKVSSNTSYYPTKGTILKDAASAPLPARGLAALLDHLRAAGEIMDLSTDC